MNLKNNEFVVGLTSHTEMEIPHLYAVTNFGRLFYLSVTGSGSSWKEQIGAS